MRNNLILTFLLAIIFSLNVRAQQNNAYPLRTSFWPNKKISVCWDNPKPETKKYQDLVRQAISETWEKYSNVKFTDWSSKTEKNGDIHIYINDENPHTTALGKKLKENNNRMVLNFTFQNYSPNCQTEHNKEFCIKATAVHEFGHALGFAHEQYRRDCAFSNCPDEDKKGDDGDYPLGACDTFSIMNYCNPNLDHSYTLSKLDIEALQKFYGPPLNQAAPLFAGIRLFHTSEIIKPKNLGKRKINRLIRVYLVGNEDTLQSVEKVVYYLHPTFRNREVAVFSKEDKFALGLKVWGEFELTADIVFENGRVKTLKRYLAFNDKQDKVED